MEQQLEGGSNGGGISQTTVIVELRSLQSLWDISTPFIPSLRWDLESVMILRANILEKRSGTRGSNVRVDGLFLEKSQGDS
jgi:hypothetical protein